MGKAVHIDESHYERLVAKARDVGQTPEDYLHALIDGEGATFDELLKPVREGFAGTSDEELDEMFARAKKAAREEG